MRLQAAAYLEAVSLCPNLIPSFGSYGGHGAVLCAEEQQKESGAESVLSSFLIP